MKYKSPTITSASGSIGGLNASHNGSGGYFRQKPQSKNGSSKPRERVRSTVGALSQVWESLTYEQRQGWLVYADNTLINCGYGHPHRRSGYSHFIRSNTARFPLSSPSWSASAPAPLPFAIIEDAPTIFEPPPRLVINTTGVAIFNLADGEPHIFIGINADVLEAILEPDPGDWVLIYTSKPYNVGKQHSYRGFSYSGYTILPEAGETPLNHGFATQHIWPTTTPFRISSKLVVTLSDGRCSNPLTVHSEYP